MFNFSRVWPEFVRQRIHETYAYFGGSVMITAASAAAIFRSPTLMNLFARTGWMSMLATMALMMGSGMIAQSIPYQEGIGGKQLAWATHCAIMVIFFRSDSTFSRRLLIDSFPILIKHICIFYRVLCWLRFHSLEDKSLSVPQCKRNFASNNLFSESNEEFHIKNCSYTAGVIGGLSTVAVCAPSDKFLYMGGPLAIGLGVVFASSVGSMFLPATTALGAGLYSMSLYGGLLLFSAFLLYDTQRIVRKAESHPLYAAQKYDPVNW